MKKLGEQEAFDQLMRPRGERAKGSEGEKRGADSGYDEVVREAAVERSWRIGGVVVLLILCALLGVAGYGFFLGLEERNMEAEESPGLSGGVFHEEVNVFTEEEVRVKVEECLRAFLQAETVEERVEYVYGGGRCEEALREFYEGRRLMDVPLWKVLDMREVVVGGVAMWWVKYEDLHRKERLVSFRRVGDEFQLQWFSFKGYGQMSWDRFFYEKPRSGVEMRGYVKSYGGVMPLWASGENVLLVSGGVYEEIALYEGELELGEGERAPVTMVLSYREIEGEDVLVLERLVQRGWEPQG